MRLTPVLLSVLTMIGVRAHGDVPLARPAQPVATPVASAAPLTARPRSFTFARAEYGSGATWGRSAWATDYPKADLQFITVAQRLLPTLDVFPTEHTVRFDDPGLRRYPFVYAVEVGHMILSDAEVSGLRSYLLAGGFLFVDDFWGSREWSQFEAQIRRVFPERSIEPLPAEHPLFTTYYDIERVQQVPAIDNICRRGRTWERDGHDPAVRGIFDDEGRLMVLISWNSDLGDAWEWAEQPCYPLELSTYAFQLGVNAIVFAMSR